MISNSIEQLVVYMTFLKENFGVNITFDFYSDELKFYLADLINVNKCTNPFCNYVRTNSKANLKCVEYEHKLKDMCDNEPFLYNCYCGIEEVIIPVKFDDKLVGSVRVGTFASGLNKSRKRIKYLVKKYNFNQDQLLQLYNNNINPTPPNFEFVTSFSNVIADSLKLLCFKYMNNKTDKKFKADERFVYDCILKHLNSCYSNSIKIEDICEEFNYSRSYINNVFHKQSKYSISKYINKLRIEKARMLLLETNMTVKEIAFMVGFSDSNYFSYKFKSEYSISPTLFRKSKKHQLLIKM